MKNKLQTTMQAIKSELIENGRVLYAENDLIEMFGRKSAPAIAYHIRKNLGVESDFLIVKGVKCYIFGPKMYTEDEMIKAVDKTAKELRRKYDTLLKMSEDDIRDLQDKLTSENTKYFLLGALFYCVVRIIIEVIELA